MLTATTLLIAGAIVALLGGSLPAGVLTQQGDEALPAERASATVDDTSTPDVLPGVDLVTEEIAPGVHRVVSDGVRRLAALDDPAIPWGDTYSIVIGRDGGVWRIGPDRDFFRLGDPATHEWTEEPALVGDEDIAIGPGGTVWSANEYRPGGLGKYMYLMSYDGTSWSDEYSDLDVKAVRVGPDETVWACCSGGLVQLGADGPTRWPVPATITARSFVITEDGARWFSTTAAGNLPPGIVRDATDPDDGDPSWERFGLELEERLGRDQRIRTAISPDGIAWMHIDGGIDDEPVLARLERDEWSTWTGADGVPAHIQTESWWGQAMSAAPDGSVWLVSGERYEGGAVCHGWSSSSERRVSHFDGTTWSHYLEGLCIHALDVAPDGNAWVRASDTGAEKDPVEFYVITPGAEPPSPSTSDDLLPGVDLVTEEVEPGVYRVVNDGVRELTRVGGTSHITIVAGRDGSIWHVDGDELVRLGDGAEHQWPGDTVRHFAFDEEFVVGADGVLWRSLPHRRPRSLGPGRSLWGFDGDAWARWQPEEPGIVFRADTGDDGATYVLTRAGVQRLDGWRPVLVSPLTDHGERPPRGSATDLVVTSDGSRWLIDESGLGFAETTATAGRASTWPGSWRDCRPIWRSTRTGASVLMWSRTAPSGPVSSRTTPRARHRPASGGLPGTTARPGRSGMRLTDCPTWTSTTGSIASTRLPTGASGPSCASRTARPPARISPSSTARPGPGTSMSCV